jgi:predicted nucleic acid binding AN1-type Zn finger protein
MSVPLITKKNKCNHCNRKPGILSTCKYCQSHYCFNCLQHEVHSCPNLVAMKEEKKTILVKKLEEEKCVKKKLVEI